MHMMPSAFATETRNGRDIMALFRKGITNRCMLFDMKAFKKYIALTHITD